MNEQAPKKLLFNSSMLMSLKAELLKKQEEVQEKKRLPQNKLENFKPSVKKKDELDKSKTSNSCFKDKLKAVDIEEIEACRKAKAALEKKTELYEHLSDRAGTSLLSSRFLVDFNTKKQKEEKQEKHEVPESPKLEDEQTSFEDNSEWLEFTDCLGRTRKCHRSDIELYRKRDQQLLKAISIDQKQDNETDKAVEESYTPAVEKPELVQRTNDYLQSLREKWEQKERELQNKDSDIHYQDILFDEARMHGVGYYSFSTDEKERQKQMDELIRQRQETIKAQQEAEEKRKKRDELMAARVAAARARQRLRAGLPPEDPEPQKDFNEYLLEFLNKHKEDAVAAAKEKEKKIKEEEEKRKQETRDAYVREWDVGKEGMEKKTKRFREMTQEEYVDQQRSKRIDEFAPPSSPTSTKKVSNNTFDRDGNIITSNKAIANKSWSDVRPKVKTPPPPNISDLDDSPQKGLYFTSATNSVSGVKHKYKNFIKSQEPKPIVNELSDNEESVDVKHEKRKLETYQTQIAPPPTFDYYGPVPKQSRSTKPFCSDLTEAYAQGTKRLESERRAKQLNKDYDFMFD